MTETTRPGYVREIFCSVQGEGISLGERHTFIRLAGCNRNCNYCDTPDSRSERPESCKVERPDNRWHFDVIENPISPREAAVHCARLDSQTVAITGGEPLVQPDFLGSLVYELKERGLWTYLETNGTLPDALTPELLSHIDMMAIDFKLSSSTGEDACWEAHADFIDKVVNTPFFIKLVVTGESTVREIRQATQLVSDHAADIPIIIQPATGERPISGDHVLELQDAARELASDVRVIPQCHKFLGVL